MKPDQDRKIVIIGMGYLMEYIAPCYRAVMKDKLSQQIVGVTADEADIPRKEAATGIHVVLNDNLGTLRAHEPDMIFFAPPPSLAPKLTDEVLVPYFAQLRAEGKPLPTIYAFPPNPAGRFYQEKLGMDLRIAHFLPNMISQIAGQDTASAGYTIVTLPDEHSSWTEEELDFLKRFWSPLGQVIFLTPAQVPAELAVSCASQMHSQLLLDMAEAIGTDHGRSLTASMLAEAARAYHLQKHGYTPPAPVESRLDAVSPELLEAVKKVTFHAYEGTGDFLRREGFPEELIRQLQDMNYDLNLRKVQLLPYRELARAFRQHATRGGVLERAFISYTQNWKQDVLKRFASYPDWTPDAAWAEALQEGFTGICGDVKAHLTRLSAKQEPAQCQIEHHATLYALLVKHAVQECGEEGRAAMREATAVYGLERGSRMRQRALRNGDTPDALSYMAYGEWGAAPGTMIVNEVEGCEEYKTHVTRCEWCRCWNKHDLMPYGKAYCQNVDVNIAHGFAPEFDLGVNALMSAGDPYCEFGYGLHMDEEKREKLAEIKERLGSSAQLDFNYHTAHLFAACRRVLIERLGQTGKDIADAALFSFTCYFGNAYTLAISALLDTDFSKI